MLPLPRLAALWAGCRDPPLTCSGCGCAGVGAQHCPLALHALWGLRATGVVGGRPWGGWPATVVRGVWRQALSLPWSLVLWGRQPGFRGPCVPGGVSAGVGTQRRPHSVYALVGWRCSLWGWQKGVPGGGAFHRCEGRLSSGASPPPECPTSGRAVEVRHPRAGGAVVRVWGPSTVPLACMPCGGCVPRGCWGAVPGGGRVPRL